MAILERKQILTEKEQKVKLSDNIKHLRQLFGWSQDDLANVLKISRGKISSYELRDVQPRLSVLAQMAKIFRVSIDELLHKDYRDIEKIGTNSAHDASGFNRGTMEAVLLEVNTRFQKEKIGHLQEIIRLKEELLRNKKSEARFLRKEGARTLYPSDSHIHLSKQDSSGKFVNWERIEVPFDHYVELGPNVEGRSVASVGDVSFEWEKRALPILEQIDFDNQRVLFVNAKSGANFEKHYHVEREVHYCIDGQYLETLSDTVWSEGSRLGFEPFEPHEMIYQSDTCLVITLDC